MSTEPTVLVIDDSSLIIHWVETALGSGYRVSGIGTRDEVEAVARRLAPVLVLVGQDVDGAGVERLRAAAAEARIVLFSNLAPALLKAAVARTGADGYLRKAGDAHAFRRALDRLLPGAQPGLAAGGGAVRVPKVTRTIVVADAGTALVREAVFSRRELAISRVNSGAEVRLALEGVMPSLLIVGPDLRDATVEDLVRSIRADPAQRKTSVMFIGDEGDAPRAAAATGAGANAVLLRPFSDEEFLTKVAQLASVEVRRATRLLVRVHVDVERDGDFAVGFTHDVSVSGMLLESEASLTVGTRVGLRFFVPGHPCEVAADADVVRLHDVVERRSIVGVSFAEIAEEDHRAIELFVAANLPAA